MVSKVSLSCSDTPFSLLNSLSRCDASPENLDTPGARFRNKEKTEFLIKNFDRKTAWDEFGLRDDVVVCNILLTLSRW